MSHTSLVDSAVAPLEDALAVHFILDPVAFVGTLVSPDVDALSLDVVVLELASVVGSISPLEESHAFLLSELVLSLVLNMS